MKRMLATGAVAALALVGSAGNAHAAADASCFGQVHKTVNSGAVAPYSNVGDLVKEAGGQGKNAVAKSLC